MFHHIIDFFSRLRLPSGRQVFGLFYAARTTTAALHGFNATVADLQGVSNHHAMQVADKLALADKLTVEAAAHAEEAQSARAVAAKITALIT